MSAAPGVLGGGGEPEHGSHRSLPSPSDITRVGRRPCRITVRAGRRARRVILWPGEVAVIHPADCCCTGGDRV
jgi:hypothetical protein